MIKEKITVILFFLILSFVILDVFTLLFLHPKIFESSNDIILEPSDSLSDVNNKETYRRIPLSISGWGSDIFHDRTNVYNDWFELTGITRFEKNYKAIVNGEIISEMDRVRGFIVTKINSKKVILRRNDYIVTLKLEE
tara:strand:+ start:1307 stop:1720 length:414 start_codon:yes stop_codon:yes gene_type:complete